MTNGRLSVVVPRLRESRNDSGSPVELICKILDSDWVSESPRVEVEDVEVFGSGRWCTRDGVRLLVLIEVGSYGGSTSKSCGDQSTCNRHPASLAVYNAWVHDRLFGC